MKATVTLTDINDDAAASVVRQGLKEYNTQQVGYWDGKPLNVLVSDSETGKVIGGMLGLTSLGLYFVNVFFLPEALRGGGLGSRMLRMGESEARQRGCEQVVLYTLTFQAPGFYERHGYREFGRIRSGPPGTARIWMTKALSG
ncbi:MAG: GNAT family N-acetyltransferase [SAR324 cluster bacterium]